MPAKPKVLQPARAVACLSTLVVVLPLSQVFAQDTARSKYQSPYAVKFTLPFKDLAGDLETGERGDFHKASTIPFVDWYGKKVLEKFGPWGPPARHFPAPAGLEKHSLDWQRQRVIAAGLKFQGYGYQHHHLPDWDPPKDWPWKETKTGHNSKGVDCSNFTSLAFNLALGLKPASGIKTQPDELKISGPGEGASTQAMRIEKPATYAELVQTLRTAYLLFIRNKKGEISHVVLWVGSIGQAPDGAPLILDSHDDGVTDCNGNTIPHGVQLRPFRENSWYFRSASHAIRILK